MLYLENNRIRLTRGDTAILRVAIQNSMTREAYAMADDDVLTLTVKQAVRDMIPVLQKRLVGANVFHIEPSDTAGLSFRRYLYDVELRTAAGDVFTVIGPTAFEVLSEVTC